METHFPHTYGARLVAIDATQDVNGLPSHSPLSLRRQPVSATPKGPIKIGMAFFGRQVRGWW
jgi:hypothetical protein